MLRCLQGLLFIGLALFTVKWTYHASPAKVVIDREEIFPLRRPSFEPIPPHGGAFAALQAVGFAAIGLYLLGTGEWCRWRRVEGRFSPLTFLALTAAFLAVFSVKFAYHNGDPEGFYPPFQEKAWVDSFFGCLIAVAGYYLVMGEIEFYNGRSARPVAGLGPDRIDEMPRRGRRSDDAERGEVW